MILMMTMIQRIKKNEIIQSQAKKARTDTKTFQLTGYSEFSNSRRRYEQYWGHSQKTDDAATPVMVFMFSNKRS